MFQLHAQVDRTGEGHRTQLAATLVHGRFDQGALVGLGIGHLAQLQRVQQLVLHLPEVRAHDARRLGMADHSAQAIALEERHHHEATQDHRSGRDSRPEKCRAHAGPEVAHVLQ